MAAQTTSRKPLLPLIAVAALGGLLAACETVPMGGGFGQNTDQTGWTVQSDTINLAGAQVKVTVDGADQPVTVTQLMPGYGSRYAFRFNPMGWTTTAGKTYKVSVTGIPTPIEYEIQVLACP